MGHYALLRVQFLSTDGCDPEDISTPKRVTFKTEQIRLNRSLPTQQIRLNRSPYIYQEQIIRKTCIRHGEAVKNTK